MHRMKNVTDPLGTGSMYTCQHQVPFIFPAAAEGRGGGAYFMHGQVQQLCHTCPFWLYSVVPEILANLSSEAGIGHQCSFLSMPIKRGIHYTISWNLLSFLSKKPHLPLIQVLCSDQTSTMPARIEPPPPKKKNFSVLGTCATLQLRCVCSPEAEISSAQNHSMIIQGWFRKYGFWIPKSTLEGGRGGGQL